MCLNFLRVTCASSLMRESCLEQFPYVVPVCAGRLYDYF
uniref:Uncharacterized protein n=1 Tax=Aegilops tauschii subsp. strangulata TaxID=200361 RepID=A0A453Q929_AEGTS